MWNNMDSLPCICVWMRGINCVLLRMETDKCVRPVRLPITWTGCIRSRTSTRCLEANSRSARKNENNDFVFKCLVWRKGRKTTERTKNNQNEMPKNRGARKECTWMVVGCKTLQWPHCWPLRQKKYRRISTTLCAKYTLCSLCSKKTQAASSTIHLAICSSNIYL